MRRRRARRLGGSGGDDPLEGVANLFDLGIVFALGFLLALLTYLGLPRLPQLDRAQPLPRYRVSEESAAGEGERLGVAYRLENGDVVYVPEESVPR